ncbi:monocarboxylate transporter 12-like [Asterias amurensis]|uniref:monocarboxylate transporter 12-like n=1 Tax=Asterias amurensis TaxID=7602 RepID=UPI003AB57751
MLYGLGLTLASAANSVILLGVSLIVMAGLGAGCVYETCRVELVFHFHDKFPLAYLLLTIGGPVGMMVYGPLTQVLLDTYGWRGTMLILGGVSFHVVICGLLIRRGKHSLKDYNKVPLDDDEVKHPNRGAYSPVNCFHKLLMFAGLDVFRNVEFLILSCARMFINIGHAGVIIYMVPNGLSLGLNTTEASFLTSAWGFGSIIGLSLSAFITQRKFISNHLTAGISGLISVICFAASPFLTTVTCQFLNLTLLSVGTEGVAQVLAVNTRNLPFSDDQQFNVVGWQCFLVGMSCTIGDIIAGWLYDATGSFQATFFMFCGTSVVTCVCLLVDLIRLRFIGHGDE